MLETKSTGLGIELPKPPKPPAPVVVKTDKPGEEKKEVPAAVDPKTKEIPVSGTDSKDDTKPLPSDPAKPTEEPKPEPLSPLEASVPLWLPEYPPINSKYLPLPYRDVWDELEKIRTNWEDMANRQVWRKLDGLINPSGKKDSAEESVPVEESGKAAEPVAGSQAKPRGKKERTNGQAKLTEPDQRILDSWQVRANSQAYKKMMEQRETLPIASFREEIVNTLKNNQVLVLSGETGCGKSTQLPSFILEDHLSRGLPCKIYVTEPRRISAISLAERVSRELGDKGVDAGGAGDDGGLVGYSIRLESKMGRNTRLAFVTNGIALRMLEAGASGSEGRGSTFDEVTHIIVDEVHERSIDSDFLLIVLKSLMEQRPDLKIVLMSATLESEKISEYFGGCPVLKVPGRTFPVKVGYLEDAVEFAGWAITDKSPYALKGRQNRNQLEWAEEPALDDDDEGETPVQADPKQLSSALYSQDTVKTVNLLDPKQIPYELVIRLLEELCLEQKSPYSQAILIFLPGLNEIRKLHDLLQDHKSFGMPQDFRVYPLHSSISTENQGAVFEIPPEGVRKIISASTETGVTIPDITCVIDSGKHREMRYDEKRAISRLTETYIARSNASQRRGRAGRVQEGLAFHLFTKARHDTQMAGHPLPEILRLSLQDLALRIKILKVKIGNTIAEGLSRALDPPLLVNITRAVNSLIEVGALTSTEQITPMGLLLSRLPVDVHLGKFLLFAALFRCLDPALTIAATLNSKSPFITPFGQESEADSIRSSFKTGNSDFLTIVNVFSIWRRMASTNPNQARTFCRRNFLSYQTLQQIEELRQQLYSYLIDSQFVPSTKADKDEISRARYHKGFRTMFVNIPAAYNENAEDEKLVAATLAAGLYPKILTTNNDTGGLKTLTGGQAISIHPSSVNFRMKMSEFEANHIVYFTIMQSKKLYAWETGPVEDMALFLLCGEHLEIKTWSGAAIIDRKIRFNVSGDLLLHLKRLREEFAQALSLRMSGKQFNEDQAKWFELGLKCLMTPPTPKEETIQRIGVQIK
ncbi:hypothetical protein FFLO_01874 [Filobasidium floriforme]|uniref:RNA helicase n=1 Tax=Filobasidium floriforme TaxID=5210 RepID=A0A8K0NSA7_9TREE|nr:P-loop containing nucleoside triphosphate hydrolase protein [Filobasidium floriforme]KAG7562714.1 hypothetical protein FFLO_01874 [Filobasidium floriforme]KAH8086812.1 P-loop containing nucleoside triphosphate hydrolase protein [Filobasidium floriforme]